jgi:iron complex transport system ATP-binding protein
MTGTVSPPGLSVRDLVVVRGRRTILADVNLAAAGGQVTALAGPNGAGKSTLLAAVAGLLPYRGDLRLDGASLSNLTREERARTVAYVPQRSRLDARLSATEVVALGRFAHRRPFGALGRRDRDVVDAAMESCAIEHLGGRAFTELSGGEQRRVLLARALATEARVLLLDEPTSSLDLAHVLSSNALLRSLRGSGCCVLVVLHDLDEVRRVADRVVLLAEGRVAASGRTDEVVAKRPVREVFGVDLVENGGLGYRLGGPP